MDADLHDRIHAFPRWHYEFELRGIKTPIFDAGHLNRHAQREAYFFRPAVNLLGGSLRGKRVLDLGCNSGYWSLKAIQAGCEQVVGVDGRAMHIDQANLVFEASGVEPHRYRFEQANIYDYLQSCQDQFDVVLCLGLMYHVNRPVTMVEGISRVNRDILVIDTSLSTRPGSIMELVHESTEEPRNSCDYELVIHPSCAAVCDIVRAFGYQAAVLRPQFSDYHGAEDFQRGSRRAFLCSKQTPLVGLTTEIPGSGVQSWRRPWQRLFRS